MAISMEKYVRVASSFPASNVQERSFGGLVFTASEMLPTATASKKTAYDNGDVVQLTLDEIINCFGSTSNEYMLANGYYGYLSPSGNFASILTFAKINTASFAPAYRTGIPYAVGDCISHDETSGGEIVKTNYKCTTAVTAEGNTGWDDVSSSFTSLTIPTWESVASKFSEIEVLDYATGTAYAEGDYVRHDGAVYKCSTDISDEDNTGWDDISEFFERIVITEFVGGRGYAVGEYVTHESKSYICQTEVPETPDAPIFYESANAAFTRVREKTNMFGSFTFLDTATKTFGVYELVEVSTANSGLAAKFLFVVNDKRGSQDADAVVEKKLLMAGSEGTVFVSGATASSGYMPMAIFGSTDYENGTVNVQMFKQFPGELPTVKDDSEYEKFKAANINFYGRTQANGSTIDFYQRGFNTNGDDTAVFCNEAWFKSSCATRIMEMFLANERVPANKDGVDMVVYEVFGVCQTARSNGMFMSKEVSNSDARKIKMLVAQNGGTNENAETILGEVETVGYSIWAFLTESGGEYQIHYYVFYGTADSIRFVKGDDILIK